MRIRQIEYIHNVFAISNLGRVLPQIRGFIFSVIFNINPNPKKSTFFSALFVNLRTFGAAKGIVVVVVFLANYAVFDFPAGFPFKGIYHGFHCDFFEYVMHGVSLKIDNRRLISPACRPVAPFVHRVLVTVSRRPLGLAACTFNPMDSAIFHLQEFVVAAKSAVGKFVVGAGHAASLYCSWQYLFTRLALTSFVIKRVVL